MCGCERVLSLAVTAPELSLHIEQSPSLDARGSRRVAAEVMLGNHVIYNT